MERSPDVEELHKLCLAVGRIKSNVVEKLAHYANLALYFQNHEITTGLMNNNEEIKINLLTGQLIHSYNEQNQIIDLTADNISDEMNDIFIGRIKELPGTAIGALDKKALRGFHDYASSATGILESFRMSLDGNFTMLHLWPEHFDFSVEWFTGKDDQQIGTGISPGDEQDRAAYLYMNPWPFNDKIIEAKLPIGTWHTSGWNGIKVELDELIMHEDSAAQRVKGLFSIVKGSFY